MQLKDPQTRLADARDYLARRRRKIRQLHDRGAGGAQVASALTDLADAVVLALFHTGGGAVLAAGPHRSVAAVCLVALGSYGRGELAPHSDVDLMVVYRRGAEAAAQAVAAPLVRDLWDVGLTPRQSVRTVADGLALARRDLSVRTALIDARFLGGNTDLFEELKGRFERRVAGCRIARFLDTVLAARAQEQDRFGSTVYLLQPDLKKSKGGLRDLQLVRWVGAARYSARTIEMLAQGGWLSAADARGLLEAREFLLRVRNDVHFHADRPTDVLGLDEQVRLAERFGYPDESAVRGVERFMQQYYRHTTRTAEVAARFIQRARPRPIWKWVLAPLRHPVDGDFLVSGAGVEIARGRAAAVVAEPARLVRLFEVANLYSVPVAPAALDTIRRLTGAPPGPSETLVQPPDRSGAICPRCLDGPTARRFLHLLRRPGRLGETLRAMHDVGVLERVVPEFEHVRCLIQFNQYHKYTVDEHTILAVEKAEEFGRDDSAVGEAYRETPRLDLLHLAILLHDLGKGYPGDHSITGVAIAGAVAVRLGLPDHDRELLAFLVRHHLVMADLAFRRDLDDEGLLVRFARQVGTPEVLRMLFILTAVDLAAVGPGTWTAWKADLLSTLYRRAMEILSGTHPAGPLAVRLQAVRREVLALWPEQPAPPWVGAQLEAMAPYYLVATPAPTIVGHLQEVRTLGPSQVRTVAEYDPQTHITEYTIYAFEAMTRGAFHKIAGALTARGLQILGARISTQPDGLIIDTFRVLDDDSAPGRPPSADRRAEVAAAIDDVLRGRQTVEALLARGRRHGFSDLAGRPPAGPTEVQVDPESSERYTIIEVFADDRRGLLYTITRTMFELGLSVALAKVATQVDQVLDVFYVTDAEGRKLTDPGRIREVCARLAAAVDHEATGSR